MRLGDHLPHPQNDGALLTVPSVGYDTVSRNKALYEEPFSRRRKAFPLQLEITKEVRIIQTIQISFCS
jgi:hypothetical protein